MKIQQIRNATIIIEYAGKRILVDPMLGEKGSFTPFLFWLENLNLRGGFKPSIMDYIKSHYPHLVPLYEEIYQHKDRTYWKQLEQEAAKMAQEAQCKYVDNKKYAHSPKEFYSGASSSIGYK